MTEHANLNNSLEDKIKEIVNRDIGLLISCIQSCRSNVDQCKLILNSRILPSASVLEMLSVVDDMLKMVIDEAVKSSNFEGENKND